VLVVVLEVVVSEVGWGQRGQVLVELDLVLVQGSEKVLRIARNNRNSWQSYRNQHNRNLPEYSMEIYGIQIHTHLHNYAEFFPDDSI
jgi:hypothetical protein